MVDRKKDRKNARFLTMRQYDEHSLRSDEVLQFYDVPSVICTQLKGAPRVHSNFSHGMPRGSRIGNLSNSFSIVVPPAVGDQRQGLGRGTSFGREMKLAVTTFQNLHSP